MHLGCRTGELGGSAMMLRWGAVLIVSATMWVRVADAGFFEWERWLGMSKTYRDTYLAGVFDSLVSTETDMRNVARGLHYEKCITDSKMTVGQLADNVAEFGKSRPKLHVLPVRTALVDYLNNACGPPRTKNVPDVPLREPTTSP
jgi:hypothetical protein